MGGSLPVRQQLQRIKLATTETITKNNCGIPVAVDPPFNSTLATCELTQHLPTPAVMNTVKAAAVDARSSTLPINEQLNTCLTSATTAPVGAGLLTPDGERLQDPTTMLPAAVNVAHINVHLLAADEISTRIASAIAAPSEAQLLTPNGA